MALRSLLGGPPLWLLAFSWWTLSGLLNALNFHQWAAEDGHPVSWSDALLPMMVGSWLWVPLTVVVFWLSRRFPLERGRFRRSLLVLFGGAFGVVFVRAALIYGGNPWVGWYEKLPSPGSVLVTSFNNNLFTYWMFVGVAHALIYAERTRERELDANRLKALLAEAELSALQAQIHPHFLFNTLQSIAELVHVDPAAADRMIVDLSALLRRSLESTRNTISSLRDEIAFLRPYLAIEQVRFGDRLSVSWDIAPEALDARVPALILQPLVENALRHGLHPRARAGKLVISADVEGERLRLEVKDDGVGIAVAAPNEDTGQEARVGVGLTNTRARLVQCYGKDHEFTLTPAPHGGTVARLELPRQEVSV